jgi:TRAP-type C4-dicarboxylate transport system substrate-binding protein
MLLTRRAFLTVAASFALSRQAQAVDSVRLRLAHPYPADWPVSLSLEKVSQMTEWLVSLEVFPEGKLGRGGELLDLLYKGPVQFGLLPASALSNLGGPFETLTLPGLFADFEHWKRLQDSVAMERINQLLERQGLGLIGTSWIGSEHLMTQSRISNPDDLRGLRLRVPSLQGVALSGYEALGVEPILLPLSETIIAAEKGIVDGVVMSPRQAIDLGFTKIGYAVQELPFSGTVAWLVHSLDVPQRMDPKVFEIAKTAMIDMLAEASEETHQAEIVSLDAISSEGGQVVSFGARQWENARRQMINRMQERLPPEGAEIMKLLSGDFT